MEGKMPDEKIPTIVIDSEKNDDWMKALPTYKAEKRIHEKLAKKLKAKAEKPATD